MIILVGIVYGFLVGFLVAIATGKMLNTDAGILLGIAAYTTLLGLGVIIHLAAEKISRLLRK